MRIGLYPGTFDPFTRGHEDLVRRASSIFGELVVGIADSKNKKPIFTLDERIQIAKEVLDFLKNDENGKMASIMGSITDQHIGQVILESSIGGKRVVNMLPGEQLPRIC